MFVDRLHSFRISRPMSARESVKNGKFRFSQVLRKDGSLKELDVDQFAGQKFMENANGFITNDIMVFEQCQSDSVARAVLSRLKVLHPESIDQSLTAEEMFDSVIPANFGSPAEFVSVHRYMVQKAYDKHEADLFKRQEELKAKEAESSSMEKAIPKDE